MRVWMPLLGNRFSRGRWRTQEKTGYTSSMDSARFGRALGLGARGAAKALVMAANAAAAPQPKTIRRPEDSSTPLSPRATDHPAARSQTLRPSVINAVHQTTEQVQTTRVRLARGSRHLGEAVWAPFFRVSGVVWVEFTGVFFGLFLLTSLTSAWRLRGSLHETGSNHTEHQRLLWSIAMAAVFGYFCVSSFYRAARRERKRG